MTKGRLNHDIDRGWAWVAAVSVYFTMIIKCITLYMGGVMYIVLLDRFEEGKAKTSLVCALNSGLLCFLSPVSGIFINKFGSRIVIVSGGVITTVGLTVSAFLNSLDAIIVTAGVIVGIGLALTTAGIIVNIVYYFQKRRNLMVTILFVVPGIGMLISAPMGLLVFETYGLSSSFLILAGLFAQTCVLGMLCKPSSLEKQFHKQRKLSTSELLNAEKGKYSCFDVTLLCNKAFFFFLWSTCSWNFALVAAFMHLPNFVKVSGGTYLEIGWLMTSFSISNMIGRLTGTFFVSQKRIDLLAIHIVSVSLAGVITALFPLYSAYTIGKYSFCILLGVLCGCPNAIMTTLSIQFVGVARIPEANGISYFFCGIGISSGPVMTGFLFGLTGSYRYSFVFAGVVLLLGSMFGIMSALLLRHKNCKKIDNDKSSDNNEQTLMLKNNGVREKQICLGKENELESQR